jgi:SWI/SNF-related matrix-associated actin-dependent regulator 1 of chromatin subfamily A
MTTTLMPHQITGARRLVNGPRNQMLAWEPRCGKTATAVRAWDEIAHEGPACVLTTATARANWLREVNTWCPEARAQVLWSNSDRPDPAADVIITNYDKLQNKTFAQALRMWRRSERGVLVPDEMHYLKTTTAQRTKCVYGVTHGMPDARIVPLVERFDRVWGLTGTPMPNHPGELYSHMKALWPETLQYNGHTMELWEFELRYCVLRETEYGMQVVGGKNLDELKRLLEPYVDRVKSVDVFPGSEPIVETWPLDVGTIRIPDLPDLVASLQQRFGDVSKIELWDDATVDAYLRAISVEHDSVAKVRHDVGTLKAISTALLVREEIENGAPKTIVFAHHREAIETLAKGLNAYGVAMIHGDTPARKRQAEIERFNGDKDCKVFVGQIKAAGEAIDLSAAEHIVFCEASWTPGENIQAMRRASGPRQKASVWVRFAYLAGSIDENVMRANARKTATVNRVF